MSNLTGRAPFQKGAKLVKTRKRVGKDAPHLKKVAQLPCVICHEYHLPQLSPTQVHHCIHGRGSMGKKAPDSMAIPLCEGHHQGNFDTSKIALHREPNAWREAYGLDTDWISWVEHQVNRQGGSLLAIRSACGVDGCEVVEFSGGYCGPHYRRLLKYGTPTGGGTPVGAPIKWIKQNAGHEGDECLLWPFTDGDGYYSISLGAGKWTKAHRRMCEEAHGPAPSGMYALHSCHNRSCVNPKHLRWGTPSENVADAREAGRMACGEQKKSAKLTDESVREIRSRWVSGDETLDSIAMDYKATRSAIWLAATGRTWRHVK